MKEKLASNLHDIYRENIKVLNEFNIDKKTFIKVCTRFNKDIGEYLINNPGFKYVLPFRLGTLSVESKHTNKRIVDWEKTKQNK